MLTPRQTDPGPGLHEILGGGADEDASSPVSFFIVRHGATKLNSETSVSVDRERGWSDVPLTAEGRQDAKAAALKLKAKGIDAIVSSDLNRAKETAEIIGKILGIKPEFSFKLRPWNLGAFTEQPMDEVTPQIEAYAKKPDEVVPKGESFNAFKQRAFEGLAEAIAKHQGENLLIVAHHRVERLFNASMEDGEVTNGPIDIKEFMDQGEPPGAVMQMKTSEAALKGSGSEMRNPNDDLPLAGMMNAGMGQPPAAPSLRQQFMSRFMQGAQQAAPSAAPAQAAAVNTLAHGRAIAGAKALHAVGHISAAERDRHVKKSQAAIKAAMGQQSQPKPFGAFAP